MRRSHVEPGNTGPLILTQDYQEADVPILGEVLCAAELVLLHAAPLYYGLGVPHGDGSAVVLIPAFLCPDAYLAPLRQWLARIGYVPFFSGIGFNTECPNLLIQQQLHRTIEKALAASGRKIHLIGHSLGGIIARAIAAQRPADIASVTTLGAPFRGTVAHHSILRAARMVRGRILAKHATGVLPDCYTGHCTCDFLESLNCALPASVLETAVYTQGDGVVDWRYCMTNRPDADFSVSGTHIGLVFNPSVYSIVAARLAVVHVKADGLKRHQPHQRSVSPPARICLQTVKRRRKPAKRRA
jgi:alpha/beta hydrolase fold